MFNSAQGDLQEVALLSPSSRFTHRRLIARDGHAQVGHARHHAVGPNAEASRVARSTQLFDIILLKIGL